MELGGQTPATENSGGQETPPPSAAPGLETASAPQSGEIPSAAQPSTSGASAAPETGVSMRERTRRLVTKHAASLRARMYQLRFRRQRRTLRVCLFAAGFLFAAGLFIALQPANEKEEEAELAPLHTRVLEAALHFLERAQGSPFDAFGQYARANAADYFREISERLWQTALPDLGWRWFFQGALMTMSENAAEENTRAEDQKDAPAENAAPAAENAEILVSFYHPWSDTALITAWEDEGLAVRISDCEILMGDIFRSRGERRAASTRAWARRQQYLAAAIGHVSATSLRALELLSYSSNTQPAAVRGTEGANAPEKSADPALWRAHIPFLLDPENLETNHVGAGILMLAAMNDVARYAAPTNAFALRVLPSLQQLHSKTNTIKMEHSARQVLQSIPENFMEYYLPAFYANNSKRAFLLLQAKRDPKKCLAFLFGLEAPDEENAPKEHEQVSMEVLTPANDENLTDTEQNEEMYPETFYTIKLLRVDLLDIQAIYANMYPSVTLP